ncbi:MAG: hypothetical protein AAF526_14055, partial [Pseudomonadota bacterium]
TFAMTPWVNRYFRYRPGSATIDDAADASLENEYLRWDEDAALEHLNAEADMGVGVAGFEAEPKRASGSG